MGTSNGTYDKTVETTSSSRFINIVNLMVLMVVASNILVKNTEVYYFSIVCII